MNTRCSAVAVSLLLLVALASCSSSATSSGAGTVPSSTAAVTSTTAAAGATVHWSARTVPAHLDKQCATPQRCVLLATENGTFDGDLRGTDFSGGATAFSENGHFTVGRVDLFRGTVKGCGSGTLVFVGSELADLDGGTGEWRIAEGFGTGDLARATGHGTGKGVVEKEGFRSQWEGVIDCGK
jgi:hypothetical protein